MKRRTIDGDVVLGPGHKAAADTEQTDAETGHDVVVLASGNLGLISFPHLPGRATLETLASTHPGLLAGLAGQSGIGFIMVRSETMGALVIGRNGIHYLSDGRVEGTDPLRPFGPRAADHLRRTDSFSNTPDILVNSFYDPDADEGAAFEELIGFHGGLGGKQAEPFLLHPRHFPIPDEPIVGAAAVHRLFKAWLGGVSDGQIERPWTKAADDDAPVRIPTTAGTDSN